MSITKKRWITDWWPNRLNLKILRQNCPTSNPYGVDYNYIEEVQTLDIDEVIKDLKDLMKKSQKWWPADFGHYGPLFIRLAWHSAGSYRIFDGRGGARDGSIRFPPRINWPDNISLDKAIKLLWPIKKKYGKKLSWADLIILSGTIAFEDMGMKILGFSLGREDIFEPDESVYWGPEEEMLSSKRGKEENVERPLAATEMGLIYVNPEGPGGNPDPLQSAKEIREIFARMGMNDEDTVALVAGGHSFGKCHGAASDKYLGKDPSSSPVEMQGLGWKFEYGTGKGPDTFTSGFELTWSPTPTKFGIYYLKLLFEYEWELMKSPAGKYQWVAKDAPEIIPDAHDPNKKHKPMMLTADLAFRYDPQYAQICKKFIENPDEFEKAVARAWFKLTHRDMGPKTCYIGKYVPQESFIWQDIMPERNYEVVDKEDIRKLKEELINSGLSIREMVYYAYVSASSYRNSDRRGGANGGRIRLHPFNKWKINMPQILPKVIKVYEEITNKFNNEQNNKGSKKRISIADLIILGGCVGIEQAAKKAGFNIEVPFTPGRVDTTQELIEVEFYEKIEPFADGFINFFDKDFDENNIYSTPEYYLVDKAHLLTLTVPEMCVLLAGLRTIGATYNFENYGVLTDNPESLSNDFFVNILDMNYEWERIDKKGYLFKCKNKEWTATRVDLIFSHHDELKAVAEVYASDDSKEKFINDFVKVWHKLMNLDRFDLIFKKEPLKV